MVIDIHVLYPTTVCTIFLRLPYYTRKSKVYSTKLDCRLIMCIKEILITTNRYRGGGGRGERWEFE